MMAGLIVISTMSSTTQIVKATPGTEQVQEVRTQYEQLQAKVNSLNEEVQNLDAQISPLVQTINDNNKKIENINNDIEKTSKEIEQAKQDLAAKEEVLGERLREVYKSGGQASYLSVLFSADSFSDLISKVDSASRILKLDKKVVTELTETKAELDGKVSSLETKANEIIALNEEIETKKSELETKKAEQQQIVIEAKEEQAEFDRLYLSEAERNLVSGYISTCKDSSKSIDELKIAISSLRSLRDNQIKSPTVIEEMNAAIEKAKTIVADKEREAERQAQLNRAPATNNKPSNSNVTVSGDASGIVSYAMKFLGRPYVYGATGPDSFDCSGFTSYVYRQVLGIDITRTTYTQLNVGRPVSQSELKPGDLVFPHAGHVGIYVGNGNMIHAPQTGDVVKVSSVYKFYAARRIVD